MNKIVRILVILNLNNMLQKLKLMELRMLVRKYLLHLRLKRLIIELLIMWRKD
jgi:hypothetical protein